MYLFTYQRKEEKKGNIILLYGKWWYQHKPWHQIAQSFAQYCYYVVEFLFSKNTQIKRMLLLDRDWYSFIAISSSICFHFSHIPKRQNFQLKGNRLYCNIEYNVNLGYTYNFDKSVQQFLFIYFLVFHSQLEIFFPFFFESYAL